MVNKNYNKEKIVEILKNFHKTGEFVANHGRNEIKKFDYTHNDGKIQKINIKKFKNKGKISKILTKYFFKSKAERSYIYSKKLIKMGIKVPFPIAYFEDFYVKDENKKYSFYICEHIDYDFDCRQLLYNENITAEIKEKIGENHQNLIKQFAKLSFDLHEKGVKFEDYSPGNVLIKKEENCYDFYLIDLNRMKFINKLTFNERMKNVSKIMENIDVLKIFSKEYAKYYKEKKENEIFNKLYFYVKKHEFNMFFKDNTREFRRKIFFRK